VVNDEGEILFLLDGPSAGVVNDMMGVEDIGDFIMAYMAIGNLFVSYQLQLEISALCHFPDEAKIGCIQTPLPPT
jgi:hypothetical protein